jgi:hypothetical protein
MGGSPRAWSVLRIDGCYQESDIEMATTQMERALRVEGWL